MRRLLAVLSLLCFTTLVQAQPEKLPVKELPVKEVQAPLTITRNSDGSHTVNGVIVKGVSLRQLLEELQGVTTKRVDVSVSNSLEDQLSQIRKDMEAMARVIELQHKELKSLTPKAPVPKEKISVYTPPQERVMNSIIANAVKDGEMVFVFVNAPVKTILGHKSVGITDTADTRPRVNVYYHGKKVYGPDTSELSPDDPDLYDKGLSWARGF